MYNSQLFTTVNHLHATFGSGFNKRLPLFIHGANDIGMASSSDPSAGKADGWGLSDPQLFLQFFERFPGEAQWGLGTGNLVGNPNVMDDSRLGRGELTARWVLSPGVPIIALAVDDAYSPQRQGQNRIWCIALNALGELFYLTKFPKRPAVLKGTRMDEPTLERLAWATGRTVYWNIVEHSRRVARPDPYRERTVDGSYSPRSSWNGMCLTEEQIKAETQEINAFLRMKPIDFRTMCVGWDMRRRMEVDFAGDDGNNAGEAVVVFDCGLEEDSLASAKRFTRLKVPMQPENKPKPKEVTDIVNTAQGGYNNPRRFYVRDYDRV
ncbi:putative f-box and wd domain-containing protein [Diplodia seriata]|uniref:Putative f-box and wd domain-containing protein n=1 Tax=Diplodia seriata TaxID=420778 RepID=A0A0G2EUE5_9PEZI|nr:putative f-box and wd domain-containing protein [Diplodia seriata]